MMFNITQNKPEQSSNKIANLAVSLLCLLIFFNFVLITPARAVVNPLLSPNNRFGIHIVDVADQEEASSAASLVDSSGGDWGYITVVAQDDNRDHQKWQTFFDDLRKRHLIPIVRLATAPQGNYWKLPYDGEETAWADFLDNLNWPARNRYVVIYNEPNQAQEWGNQVDASSYAQVLSKTIDALKQKNQDFFVLNAGLDASAPEKLPSYEDEEQFLKDMNSAVPGIFNKLDGWTSHSYPNPGFAGSPNASGRGSVKTYEWEQSVLQDLGLTKNLPIFITETGWKHAEGLNLDTSLPTSDTVGNYLKTAFSNVWNDPRIVAVTPFLLDYQASPFDHFSFEKPTGKIQNEKILGATTDQTSLFYPQYLVLQDLPKNPGSPLQVNKGSLVEGSIYYSLVSGESYSIPLTFQNQGQSIWGEQGQIRLVPTLAKNELGINVDPIPDTVRITPGQSYTIKLNLKAPQGGDFKVNLSLFNGPNQVDTGPMEFETSVKSPVMLDIKASLKWKDNFSGDYLLSIFSDVAQSTKDIILGQNGDSGELESRELLPDYTFDFTLSKPFYQPKTIHTQVHSGLNTLNFGELQPDISSAILNPGALWKLLPFSN